MSSGTALVQGRLDPRVQHAALANDCFFRPAAWTLAHARDRAPLDALEQADVFLSGLENERPW